MAKPEVPADAFSYVMADTECPECFWSGTVGCGQHFWPCDKHATEKQVFVKYPEERNDVES